VASAAGDGWHDMIDMHPETGTAAINALPVVTLDDAPLAHNALRRDSFSRRRPPDYP
jgi:hypothetical protein